VCPFSFFVTFGQKVFSYLRVFLPSSWRIQQKRFLNNKDWRKLI